MNSWANKLGTIGIVIALVAITIAIFQDKIRTESAPIETTISARVIDKTADLLGFGSTTNSEKYDVVSYGYIGLGLLALILGVTSYLRKESHRFSGMAAALGIVAIAWEYVLIGLIIAVVIFILANFDIS